MLPSQSVSRFTTSHRPPSQASRRNQKVMAEAELVVRRASIEADLAREEAAEMRAAALSAATEARTAEVEAGVSRRDARDARAQGQLELSELREACAALETRAAAG